MSCTRALAGVCLILSLLAPAMGSSWTLNASLGNAVTHQRLYEIGRHFADTHFDPDANLIAWTAKNPPHQKSHSTRESAYYAYGLLLSGDAADRMRAQAILLTVIATQDARPGSPTRGVFLSSSEDHWDSPGIPAKNIDRNWAAFIGLILVDVIDLDRRHPALDDNVRRKVDDASRLAVQAVISRNVTPGYTNIAILSMALASAGEKLWAMPGAGAFAQAKLEAILAMTGDNEFCEYLSPTYSGVDIYGAYMARKLAFSDPFSARVDVLIDHLWKQTAASYHAPSCQLAGPYTRAYGEDMLDYAASIKYFIFLGRDGDYPLPDTEVLHDVDKGPLLVIADLPISPRGEFKTAPPTWREFTSLALDGVSVRHLFQYREGNFVLGTVASQDEFSQRRNLVADWRNDDIAAGGFHVGYCLDESSETVPKDFNADAIHFYSQQQKSAALVAIVSAKSVPAKGGCMLVFDSAARLATQKESGRNEPAAKAATTKYATTKAATTKDAAAIIASDHLRIDDGSMTAYLFSVSTSNAGFTTRSSTKFLRAIRDWTSADTIGSCRVLSYFIVFRPSTAPAPVFSDVILQAADHQISITAKCDGVVYRLSF